MAGTKYILKNNTTAVQFFDYKTLSDSMWNYQVSLNPGQTKTIWAETGTLKIYNNNAITVEEQLSFPPAHADITGGNNGINPKIDYENKSILIFSQLPNSTNLGYSILDFEHNVIYGPIDLGYNTASVAGGGWRTYDIDTFTNSGYMIYLNNTDNVSKASIYLDYRGTVIGEYSASTTDTSYGMLNGKLAYFIDYDNIFNYSDGKTFKSREINLNYNQFGVVNGYWDSNNNNSFVTYSTNGSYNSYTLITMEREIPLVSWDGSNTGTEVFQYSNSNFTTTMNYNNSGDTYIFFNIYSSTGSILQSINLTSISGNSYNNFDLSFFGTNKMNIIFYNDNDVTTPYLIYTYDGETDTLISTTHQRTTSFSDWNQRYDSLYDGDTNFPSQDFHIFFYNESDDNYDFITSLYFNVLSYFSGDTEYRTPYIINYSGGTVNWVNISDEFLGSSLMVLYYSSTILKLLTITSDGVSYVDVTPLGPLDGYNIRRWWVGDTFIFMTFTDYDSDGTLYAYDAMGNQLDYVLFYGGWNDNYNMNSYGTFYFETDPGAYYFNTTNSKFTSIDYQDYRYIANLYYTDTFKRTSNMLLIRYDMVNTYARLLTENNLTPEVILPLTYDEPSYEVGKDVIFYIYINENDKAVINLYNTSFGLLQSLTTNYNSWNDIIIVENRVLFQIQDGGTYINYMVSANGIKMVESTNSYDYRVPNDYAWWND